MTDLTDFNLESVAPGKFVIRRGGRTYLVLVAETESELVEPMGFGVDPGDSAALYRLRCAIDDHLPEFHPEAIDGDYEGIVRKAGAALIAKADAIQKRADEQASGTLLRSEFARLARDIRQVANDEGKSDG